MKNIIALIVLILVAAGMFSIVSEMPTFGGVNNPHQNEIYDRYLSEVVEETGSLNTVSAIITDYRAFDTLGEATVLFATIAAIYATLIAAIQHKEEEEADQE